MAKFGEFKYGGTTPEQEKYLARIQKGIRRERAGAVRGAMRRVAYTGMGASGPGLGQVAGISQAYGQKLAETSGAFRQRAAETARESWMRRRGAEFEAETAAERQKAGFAELAKTRAAEAKEAHAARVHRTKEAKRLKKKSTWDYIREGVGMLTG